MQKYIVQQLPSKSPVVDITNSYKNKNNGLYEGKMIGW